MDACCGPLRGHGFLRSAFKVWLRRPFCRFWGGPIALLSGRHPPPPASGWLARGTPPLAYRGSIGVEPKRGGVDDILPDEADVAELAIRHPRELAHRSALCADPRGPGQGALEGPNSVRGAADEGRHHRFSPDGHENPFGVAVRRLKEDESISEQRQFTAGLLIGPTNVYKAIDHEFG
jgi:hypothetical protein